MKKNNRFFKKCWILLGLQVACQVVILVADAVEWWNGFRIQATESCNVLRVLSLSMMFFQITNLTAIMKVCYQHPSVHAEHKLYAVLFLGFIASAMIFWPWCFSKTAIFQVVHKAALLLTMSIDVYLVSVALAKDNAEYNEEFMSSKSDAAMDSRFLLRSWRAWTDNKKSLFVIVFLAACSVLIFSDVALARFESALWGRFEKRHVVWWNCLFTDPEILFGNMFAINTVWFNKFKLSQKERQRHHNSNNLKESL